MSNPGEGSDLVDLGALVRGLPVPACPPGLREQARVALLERAHVGGGDGGVIGGGGPAPDAPSPASARRRRARRALLVAGVATAAVAATLLFSAGAGEHVIPRSGQPAPRAIATQAPERPALAPYRGTITAGPGARFQRLGGQPDEVVRLHEGIITCEVAPLRAGERFRVLVGDGEIEVHGTTFTLEAGADRLVAVSVREGLVELRPREAPPVHLGASARWQAPVPTAAPRPPARPPEPPRASTRPPEPPRARRHARAASGPAAPAPPRPSIAEQTFADAWAALREGQLERAAAAFARVSDAEPGSPLAEDAAFWRAVALQRARHAPEARRALEAFLAGHPLSDRAGEASVMLGWLLLDAGEPAAAAGRFRAALGDRLEPVRRSAEAGLAATGHGH